MGGNIRLRMPRERGRRGTFIKSLLRQKKNSGKQERDGVKKAERAPSHLQAMEGTGGKSNDLGGARRIAGWAG